MRNIVLAIEKEKEYLRDKVEIGDPELNIYNYLYEAGYYRLEDFHFDKTEYLLKQQNLTMERIFITTDSLNNWVDRVMTGETFFCSADTETTELGTVAICGYKFNDFDKYIENGVLPVVFNYSRGVNITGIHDFNFCICVPLEVELTSEFLLKKLLYFIYKKNPTARIDSNDIMVEDRKVVGLTPINNPEKCVFIVHISLTDYIDLIYKLCPPKDPNKKPGFLTNITKQEFEEEVQSWLKP